MWLDNGSSEKVPGSGQKNVASCEFRVTSSLTPNAQRPAVKSVDWGQGLLTILLADWGRETVASCRFKGSRCEVRGFHRTRELSSAQLRNLGTRGECPSKPSSTNHPQKTTVAFADIIDVLRHPLKKTRFLFNTFPSCLSGGRRVSFRNRRRSYITC
jgi:hypothetical protein